MRFFRTTLLLLATALLSVAISPRANADEWDKKTVVSFDQDVAIPGQVLPAGTYVFKLAGTTDRSLVQVWDADQTYLYATLITVREPSSETPDEPYFYFDYTDTNEGFPPALASWFYPGDNTGWTFIYSGNYSQQVRY
jgi:hypothetical protein